MNNLASAAKNLILQKIGSKSINLTLRPSVVAWFLSNLHRDTATLKKILDSPGLSDEEKASFFMVHLELERVKLQIMTRFKIEETESNEAFF